MLAPLHYLLQKNVSWKWKREHDMAVSHIKRQLGSDNTLAHFNPNAKRIITIDASPTSRNIITSRGLRDLFHMRRGHVRAPKKVATKFKKRTRGGGAHTMLP